MFQKFGRFYWDDETGDVSEEEKNEEDDADWDAVDLEVDRLIEQRYGIE